MLISFSKEYRDVQGTAQYIWCLNSVEIVIQDSERMDKLHIWEEPRQLLSGLERLLEFTEVVSAHT